MGQIYILKFANFNHSIILHFQSKIFFNPSNFNLLLIERIIQQILIVMYMDILCILLRENKTDLLMNFNNGWVINGVGNLNILGKKWYR